MKGPCNCGSEGSSGQCLGNRNLPVNMYCQRGSEDGDAPKKPKLPLSDEEIRDFVRIINEGGEIVCAPDVYRDLVFYGDTFGGRLRSVAIRSSNWIPAGTICAVSRKPVRLLSEQVAPNEEKP